MFRKYIGTVYIVPLPGFHEVPQYYCPSLLIWKLTCGFYQNILASYLKLIFHKDWYHEELIPFASVMRLVFFHSFCLLCSQGVLCLLLLWELWKSKTCNYCLLPVIRHLQRYYLGRNSFQIFQVDYFSEKRICIISADLCNPCIIMYEILYIRTCGMSYNFYIFIYCAQISKTITWAYFSNYLSELPRTKLLFYQKYLLIEQLCYIT